MILSGQLKANQFYLTKTDYKMYRVEYLISSGARRFKSFETLHEATVFANKQPIDSIIEITHYEGSDNNRPTLRSEK